MYRGYIHVYPIKGGLHVKNQTLFFGARMTFQGC